jgi:hypothetical protein
MLLGKSPLLLQYLDQLIQMGGDLLKSGVKGFRILLLPNGRLRKGADRLPHFAQQRLARPHNSLPLSLLVLSPNFSVIPLFGKRAHDPLDHLLSAF